MFDAVNQAIRKRFATAYADVRGEMAADVSLPEFTPTYLYVGADQPVDGCGPIRMFWNQGSHAIPVLVFQENRDGQDAAIENTIEFQPIRTRYRDEDIPPGVDVSELGQRTVVLKNGKTITGPELIRLRPGAQPESLYYEFRVESREAKMANRLVDAVSTLFPSRGAIDISRADGSTLNIAVFRSTNWYRSSLFDATLAPGDPGLRRYQWTAQYHFESYTDNTLQGRWLPTILSRTNDVRLITDPEPQDC